MSGWQGRWDDAAWRQPFEAASHAAVEAPELPPDPRVVAAVRIATRAACLAVPGLAGVGLLATVLAVPVYGEHQVTMKLNCAIGLLLLAVSLRLAAAPAPGRARRWGTLACAGLVVAVAGATLVEYVAGVNLHIDELVWPEIPHPVATSAPGRMAPNSAVGLILVALAHAVVTIRPRWVRGSQLLALGGVMVGLLGVYGVIYQVAELERLGSATGMAAPTAVSLVLLGIGTFFLRPTAGLTAVVTSHSVSGLLGRQMLAATLVVPPLLGWLRLLGQDSGAYGTRLGIVMLVTANVGVLGALGFLAAGTASRVEVARMRAERAVRGYAQVQALMDHTSAVIFMKDLNSRYLMVNTQFERILGFDRGAVIGATAHDLLPREVADEFRANEAQVLSTGRALQFDEVLPGGDGGPRHYLTTLFPLKDATGHAVALCGVATDVTDRVAAERERERLRLQLRQRERLDTLGQLAGGIAHDFNNLLSAILGHADFLLSALAGRTVAADAGADGATPGDARPHGVTRDGATPDSGGRPVAGEVRAAAGWGADPLADVMAIVNAAEHGAALTRQLLIFSRLEPSRPELLSVNEVVQSTRELLCRTLGEHIQLDTRLAADLDAVTLDRSKLEQVVINLLLNARDAMPGGGRIRIETANETLRAEAWPGVSAPDGPHVRVTVVDTGRGMEPDVASHAFEPFFTTKPPGEGTGLGLATVYGVVKEAGGHLSLSSEPGIGTVIHLYFPAAASPALPTGAEVAPRRPRGNGETIVLAEDDVAVRDILRRLLTFHGYVVHATGSAGEALLASQRAEGGVDALIADVVMPGMGGRQLAARIRRLQPRVAVLLMSGYTREPPDADDLPAGAVLLHKPFDTPTLLHRLRSVLDGRQDDPAPPAPPASVPAAAPAAASAVPPAVPAERARAGVGPSAWRL